MSQPTTPPELDRMTFLRGVIGKPALLLNAVMALAYFTVLAIGFQPGNHLLFYLLLAGEVFHLFQILGYCYTVWDSKQKAPFDPAYMPPVDVFITVAGEPVEIVRETAMAALAMQYPHFKVYLLNDGLVAKKDNWKDIDALALSLKIRAITRTVPGGAKAGNINHALAETTNPYVVIFDADHVPHPDFLKKTMGYFHDSKMGFIQTPQFYKNQSENQITEAAWDQQALFFGPIMRGKNRTNSAFMCGTNMVLNRKAVMEAGGMCETNIAEDFLTSLFVHEMGWKSFYVPEVLAEGLAPEDFLSYYKQQYRWGRGSLEVIFKYNPLLRRGLAPQQRLQYLISASYFLSGLVVLYDAILPLIFMFTGIIAVNTSTMELAIIFLPYIFMTLYTLQLSSNFSLSYKAIAFSISSFFLQLRAIAAVLLGQKTSFSVTSKQQLEGNFLYLTIPHLTYIVLAAAGLIVGLLRSGVSASLLANFAWVAVDVALFLPFIAAAAPHRKKPVASPEPVDSPPVSKKPMHESQQA
jgi:cellulose synthase (UDP-forming)